LDHLIQAGLLLSIAHQSTFSLPLILTTFALHRDAIIAAPRCLCRGTVLSDSKEHKTRKTSLKTSFGNFLLDVDCINFFLDKHAEALVAPTLNFALSNICETYSTVHDSIPGFNLSSATINQLHIYDTYCIDLLCCHHLSLFKRSLACVFTFVSVSNNSAAINTDTNTYFKERSPVAIHEKIRRSISLCRSLGGTDFQFCMWVRFANCTTHKDLPQFLQILRQETIY